MEGYEINFTTEEISMLAQQQRDMDAGKVFYVILDGERVAVLDMVAKELGLEQGQTINRVIFRAMLETQLAFLQADMEMRKISESAGTPK